jgi:hypothetical protein
MVAAFLDPEMGRVRPFGRPDCFKRILLKRVVLTYRKLSIFSCGPIAFDYNLFSVESNTLCKVQQIKICSV